MLDTRSFVKHRNEEYQAEIRTLPGGAPGEGGPCVSILIPTSDGSRGGYLPQLLEQLQGQSFQDFEVILVQGDRRQGRAINTAAGMARGRILVTFDDDSRLGNERVLENLVRALESDPRIGMVGGCNTVPGDAPWLVRRIMAEVPRRSSSRVEKITDSDMAEHPCLAIRKDVFYQIGGEHEIVPRGLDPYLRKAVRDAGYRVVVAPDVVYHHLPPPTLGKVLKQFYRNGRMSALVSARFPDLALDNALSHGDTEIHARPLWYRVLRHGARMLTAFITLRWIYLATMVAYGMGAGFGAFAERRLQAEGER